MKRLSILLLVLCAMCASIHAQRLNDLGLKMVKEFTVRNFKSDGSVNYVTRYVYDYDKKDRMISLTVYTNGKKRGDYTNDGNNITYWYYLGNPCKCIFKQDRYRNITSFEFIELDEEDLNTPCWKTEYKYWYSFDKGTFVLSHYAKDDYSYSPIENKFYKNKTNVKGDVINNNGLYKGTQTDAYTTDFEHPNDTNISFYMIIEGTSISYVDLFTNDLMNTEWINIRSPYFPKCIYESKENQFHYDSKGNIIKIDIYENYGRKRLAEELEIKYVD